MKYFWNNKKIFIVTILLVMGILGTATTFSLLTSNTVAVENSFSTAEVTTHIEEEFEGKVEAGSTVKKTPSIVNDGPSNAYIRARITVSPEDADITLLLGNWEEMEFTKTAELSQDAGYLNDGDSDGYGWYYNEEDGFFYYNTTTTPDETSEFHVTDTIFDAVFIGEEIKSDFDITIYQEAVYSGDDVPGTKRTVQEIEAFFDEIDAEKGNM